MEKYKNSIYFGMNSKHNIIYHFDGKIYFGGWNNNTGEEGYKTGEGI